MIIEKTISRLINKENSISPIIIVGGGSVRKNIYLTWECKRRGKMDRAECLRSEEVREEEAVLKKGEEEEEEEEKSVLVVVWSLCLSGPHMERDSCHSEYFMRSTQ